MDEIKGLAADVAFTLSPMGRERREDREIAYAEEIARLRAKVEALRSAIRQLVPGQPDESDED